MSYLSGAIPPANRSTCRSRKGTGRAPAESSKYGRTTKERNISHLEETLAAMKDQGKAHVKNVCVLLTHRTLGHYLRQQKDIFICFLALLLVRIAERKTGITWDRVRSSMERFHLGEFSSKDGRVLQCTGLTQEQLNLLKQFNIPLPTRVQKGLFDSPNP